VYAGKHSSAISQADADAKALNDITANGQAYANQQGVCTFLSAAQSVVYSKDCAVGGVGSYVTYNIPAGKYISVISQEDADVKAYNDIDDNAQIYANANGTCTFKNTVRSQAFTRNNCAAGGTPSSVTYTVPAGKHTSLISQADADAKALNDINANGQAYANTNATCTFYNTVRSQTFTRNNCATGGVPSNFTYIVPAARHSSLISQADADAKAQNDMNSNGQASANIDANATCTFSNTELRSDFRRAVCTDVGYVGGYITYIVPAAKYTSIISQADADAKAQNDANLNGQIYANINGPCNCAAEGYKLINGNCEKGVRIDYQEPIGGGRCRNYYRYRFSDGSLSQIYNIAFDGC
jgi:hypothetical protein